MGQNLFIIIDIDGLVGHRFAGARPVGPIDPVPGIAGGELARFHSRRDLPRERSQSLKIAFDLVKRASDIAGPCPPIHIDKRVRIDRNRDWTRHTDGSYNELPQCFFCGGIDGFSDAFACQSACNSAEDCPDGRTNRAADCANRRAVAPRPPRRPTPVPTG